MLLPRRSRRRDPILDHEVAERVDAPDCLVNFSLDIDERAARDEGRHGSR